MIVIFFAVLRIRSRFLISLLNSLLNHGRSLLRTVTILVGMHSLAILRNVSVKVLHISSTSSESESNEFQSTVSSLLANFSLSVRSYNHTSLWNDMVWNLGHSMKIIDASWSLISDGTLLISICNWRLCQQMFIKWQITVFILTICSYIWRNDFCCLNFPYVRHQHDEGHMIWVASWTRFHVLVDVV